MRTRHARKIRFGLVMGRATAKHGHMTYWTPQRVAEVYFPSANPFCRLEHFAFLRAYLTERARTPNP